MVSETTTDADRAIQARVNFEIAAELIGRHGLDEEIAKAIVRDMVRGRIPRVKVDYR